MSPELVRDFWNNTSFYCLNYRNHESPHRMFSWKFADAAHLACPKVFPKGLLHPDGCQPGACTCSNHIPLSSAYEIISRFATFTEREAAEENEFVDHTGMTFVCDGISVKVLKDSPYDIRFGILPDNIGGTSFDTISEKEEA